MLISVLHAAAALLALAQAPGAMDPPDPEWNCNDPGVQAEMNWCAARELAVADAHMEEQLAATLAILRKRDQDYLDVRPEGDTRPGHVDSLLQAQAFWLVYREAHCRADGYAARGGSLEPLLAATCKTGLTYRRIDELDHLAQPAM
jgi:uncharacterized protein YecT (DUF1311 family)